MNVDPTTAVKLEDHLWGLGDDAYATGLDVFHQLHCLNSLRRRVYSQYYFSEEHHHHAESWTPGDGLTIDEIHINHCVDILAQALRCSGNVALVSMHWMENEHYPFPDMSVDRKCIDFDALVQWRKENTIDMKKYIEVMGKPAGVVQRPTPDGYYQYIATGEVNPHHINGSNMDEDYIA
ncbi:hypothetical protein GQ53DRAFT_832661 [Thozetella sp. PMI_491]|nr:hypothetical protein GQ53DRAFT_832661 [Thozetella sp. PMI_491]